MELNNTYWLLRHGHSQANAEDLIVASPTEGCDPKWGLSDTGRLQADAAGETLLSSLGTFDAANLLFFASPFSRTVETALRVGSHLQVHLHDPRFCTASELQERNFGEYELTSTSNYALVWAEDGKDASSRPPGDGGESVEDVAARETAFIASLEAKYKNYNIVLTSHGDALSILAAVLLGTDLRQHRQYGLGNCSILRIPVSLE